jgi:hypothetical protein
LRLGRILGEGGGGRKAQPDGKRACTDHSFAPCVRKARFY